MPNDSKTILVVGGGIAGITAALEAAEVGHRVVLIEKNPYLGGRVAQMYRYFPKLCPPSCGLEINFKRLKASPRVRVMTMTEVVALAGEQGRYEVELRTRPRYVNENCTCCGKCSEACTIEVDNPFNFDMDRMKAASLPHLHAFPARFLLHPDLIAAPAEAQRVKEACEAGAIDLEDQERREKMQVASIIWATGWDPFDPRAVDYYRFGQQRNVITNVMMERLAALEGPTGGQILRPSDGKPPKHVVFVQCAGSRDENHLAYCSGVCCLASLKQATYLREKDPESRATICYIDIRTPDRLEDFYVKVQQDEGVNFVKSKIADITEDPATGELTLTGENTLTGERFQTKADLVVLATGIVPSKAAVPLATDEYGFLLREQAPGQHPAGCALRPVEVSSAVQDATASALHALQSIAAR